MSLRFCQRGLFILNSILKIIYPFFLLSFLFFLATCGSSEGPSTAEHLSKDDVVEINDLSACFVFYDKDKSELIKYLNYLTELIETSRKVNYFHINVIGCLNYQLGNYSAAEEWLKKSFQEAGEGRHSAKYAAAYALILIYLKQDPTKIVPAYIEAAVKIDYGRWAAILYYIEQYRISGQRGYLVSAIEQTTLKMDEEIDQQDEPAPTTKRFLEHMRVINDIEDSCKVNPTDSRCLDDGDLADEKFYMFATAHGLLSMLLKEPPFDQKKTEESSDN